MSSEPRRRFPAQVVLQGKHACRSMRCLRTWQGGNSVEAFSTIFRQAKREQVQALLQGSRPNGLIVA